MPSTMTHTYFSQDVYKLLPKNMKNKIKNLEYLKLFAQGSDPLMFYNFFVGKKAKYYNRLQFTLHTSKTQDLFLNLVHYIDCNGLNNDVQVMAFLYGSICHYFLDLYAHPFIIYKTGKFNKKKKDTYKYNSLHQEMEYIIDMYYIYNKELINPSKYKIHKNIYKIKDFSFELKKCLDYTFYKTYKIHNFSSVYEKASKEMKLFFRLFNYDRFGIKKVIYNIMDILTPSYVTKLKELSFSCDYSKKIHYLNLKKDEWCHPADNKNIYNYSFLELYDMALKDAVTAIKKVTKMLDNKKVCDYELKKIFKNLSYTSGMSCDDLVTFKYFEF